MKKTIYLLIIGLLIGFFIPKITQAANLDHLVIEPSKAYLSADDTIQFKAKGYDAENNEIEGLKLTWSTSNEAVGTIDQNGLFEAKIAGTTQVLVSCQEVSAGAEVTVTHGKAVAIDLLPDTATINVDQTKTFNIFALDSDTNRWDITKEAELTIDQQAGGSWQDNIYLPEKAGTFTVKAKYQDLSDIALLTIKEGKISYIIIRNQAGGQGHEIKKVDLTTDDSLKLYAAGYDENKNFVADQEVYWNTTGSLEPIPQGPSSMITFAPKKATTKGTIAIYADPNQAPNDTTGLIRVFAGVLDHLVISPDSNPEVIPIGQEKQFTAKGYDQNNNEIQGLTFTWKLEGDIGQLDEKGLFKAEKAGPATITVEAEGLTKTINLLARGVVMGTETTKESPSEQEFTTEKKEGTVLGEKTEEGAVAAAEEEAEAEEEAKTCTTLAWWLWLIFMAGYLAILIIYYIVIKRTKGLWWCIFPVVLTGFGIWMYLLYACNLFQWWPWVLVILGIIVSLFRPKSFEGEESL